MVELADREVSRERPRLAAIGRDRIAAVLADDDARGLVRCDPNRMVVDVHVFCDLGEFFAAVLTLGERFGNGVDVIAIARIDGDV